MRQSSRPGDVDPAAGGHQGTANRDEEDAPATGAAVTIPGQALRAAALSPAGDRPVDHADATVVQAAVQRAAGQGGVVVPGGVAAVAQRAAETNKRPPDQEARGGEEAKPVALRDVLCDPSAVVPGDRAATWLDAEKVAAAYSAGEGGGMGEVADAMAAAALMNEGHRYDAATLRCKGD
ncbi:hypothetical protein BDA96_04G208400 [Sorghum bicolor]|uniref:SMP domain-containing protein n=2 Tax=Sorghum bicolor TaxID=4558 RepID=C5XWC8_SORBI|nr:hypothetical protein SORBI_3004G196000 [Sorghum bicolor]KAG0533621.1 hypothetical protein BDA96_04G208400 [Sorghum bicolor]